MKKPLKEREAKLKANLKRMKEQRKRLKEDMKKLKKEIKEPEDPTLNTPSHKDDDNNE